MKRTFKNILLDAALIVLVLALFLIYRSTRSNNGNEALDTVETVRPVVTETVADTRNSDETQEPATPIRVEDTQGNPIPTQELTATPAVTPTSTPAPTPTVASTPIPAAVPTSTPSPTLTATPTASPTQVPTATLTASPTQVPTATPSPTPTTPPTSTPTASPTPAPTPTATPIPVSQPSETPTAVQAEIEENALEGLPSGQLFGEIAQSLISSLEGSKTGYGDTVNATATPSPSPTATATPTATPSSTPAPTATPSPSPSPTAIPTATPTPTATVTPTPTSASTAAPTPTPVPTPRPALEALPEAMDLYLLDTYEVGVTVKFGRYEQDGNRDNGKEGLEWIILDIVDDKALLVSVYALEKVPYNSQRGNVTWEESNLYRWLEEEFYTEAFTVYERGDIVLMPGSAATESESNVPLDGYITSHVSILSEGQLLKYMPSENERICEPSAYTATRGGRRQNGACMWYTWRPNEVSANGRFVASTGEIYLDMNSRTEILVRPCIWVTLK